MQTAAIWILGVGFAGVLIWIFLIRLQQFLEELDYINAELERSIKSRKYWLRERRRLWLWLLLGIPRGE